MSPRAPVGPRAVGSDEPRTAEGYRHELGVYTSDEEFGELICPFALGGLDAGEPVVFAYDERKVRLLQRWLPDSPGITYITDMGPYATPARALAAWRKLVEDRLGAGAPRVRIAGNVPHPGYGRSYAGWDRYEAALDRALGDLPVWAPCLYDARLAPAAVLETAGRRHRYLRDRDGRQRDNDTYEHAGRLADFLPPPPEPLERTTPVLTLIDPRPSGARDAVNVLSAGHLPADQRDDLILAMSEAVTNALVHGEPPVRVRMWLGEHRVVVEVHDEGRGPLDPLAGLLPGRGDDAEGGRGLWLSHHLGIDVALIAGGDGFSVRLGAGAAQPEGQLPVS